MSKAKIVALVVGAFLSLALAGAATAQQKSGMVGSGPPEDIALSVTIAADGGLTLSQSEIHLALGGYYRFNLDCPPGLANEAGISFVAPDLLENSHLRLLSVGDPKTKGEINFHLQGLNFRMIECEGLELAARFSFNPMRKGTYGFTVSDTKDPPHQAKGEFIVE